VVTASYDQTARVWNAATGMPVTGPLEHRHQVVSAAFSPDGTHLVTASGKTAQMWDVRLDEGTFEQWSAIAERSPFVLSGITHMRRAPRPTSKPVD
jgi:WD40 repeat protein